MQNTVRSLKSPILLLQTTCWICLRKFKYGVVRKLGIWK